MLILVMTEKEMGEDSDGDGKKKLLIMKAVLKTKLLLTMVLRDC